MPEVKNKAREISIPIKFTFEGLEMVPLESVKELIRDAEKRGRDDAIEECADLYKRLIENSNCCSSCAVEYSDEILKLKG